MSTTQGWHASSVKCCICTNEWTAVYPAGTDEDALECESCGAKDAKVAARIMPDGSVVTVDEEC